MSLRLIKLGVVAALAGIMATASSAAQLETPKPRGWVTDLAGVLSSKEVAALDHLLAQYERETTHQIMVLTVPTLAGETIEDFALRVANTWGVGRKGVDNGILVVVALAERRMRIELGYGFERHISNDQAAGIIRNQMAPSFKDKAYAQGLEQGLQELMRLARALAPAGKRSGMPYRLAADLA